MSGNMQENGLLDSPKLETKQTKSRPTWDKKLDFFFNIIGYTIGLGNVWRFPYLCYKNGGGAFLIPYIILMLCCALPIFFLEMSLGQFTKQSCIGAWRISPVVQGVGYSTLQMMFYYLVYINVLMAWCVFYFVHSFTTATLPWSTCDNAWNSDKCIPAIGRENTSHINQTGNLKWAENGTSSEEEFWNNYVLQKTAGIHDLGGLSNWRMILCFIASWVVSYLCIYKGIKTSGKVAYVTATLPYVMVLILLVRGLTLEGALDGILFYLTPVPSKLLESTVWIDAGGQVLFSIGVCYNVLYCCGSYNKFDNNCYKQSFLFVLVCGCTSFVIGFAVFGILGHIAHVQGKNVSDVTEGGPGLVFQVVPMGLSLLPTSQLWSAIFFIMMILISIDTAFAILESFLVAFEDLWPRRYGGKSGQRYRTITCIVLALLGLPMLTDGGIYIFEIFNIYGGSGICILWTAFFETIGIAWIYGVDKFYEHVKKMIGYYPNVAFKFCYRYLTPILLMAIFIFYCCTFEPLKMGKYSYPWWANMIGWIMSSGVILAVPWVAVKRLINAKGTMAQVLLTILLTLLL